MNDNGNYGVSLPYPPIDDVTKNLKFAGFINETRNDELEAISEYLYQSIIFGDAYPELASLLEGIATVEMLHFELLSDLLLKLGVNPVVNTRIRNHAIDISEDSPSTAPRAARRAILRDIAAENSAETMYLKLAASTNDKSASDLLIRIAKDEEMHADLLKKALDNIKVL